MVRGVAIPAIATSVPYFICDPDHATGLLRYQEKALGSIRIAQKHALWLPSQSTSTTIHPVLDAIALNPTNSAWHTANRNRNPPSANRTPQNRSGNASPAPSFTPSQPPKQDTKQSGPSNAWAQRNAGDRNGPQEEAHVPLNGFNAAEIKAFLGREAAPTPYKPQEVGGARAGGGAWGQKRK